MSEVVRKENGSALHSNGTAASASEALPELKALARVALEGAFPDAQRLVGMCDGHQAMCRHIVGHRQRSFDDVVGVEVINIGMGQQRFAEHDVLAQAFEIQGWAGVLWHRVKVKTPASRRIGRALSSAPASVQGRAGIPGRSTRRMRGQPGVDARQVRGESAEAMAATGHLDNVFGPVIGGGIAIVEDLVTALQQHQVVLVIGQLIAV